VSAPLKHAVSAPLFAATLLLCSCNRPEVAADSSSSAESTLGALPEVLRDSAIAATPPGDSLLLVRILDVGQGDAVLIENGGTRILIDGGPGQAALGQHLDRLGVNNDTIDVVLLSHPHADHYMGLREIFRSSRRIVVRYLFENRDPSPNVTLAELRDSILARAGRDELVYRDTDDPCGDGTPLCTMFMRGGAQLHILRPDPAGDTENNRSTPAKLVGPDSASFTMWFGGDAEGAAIAWFGATGYDAMPGMKVSVLKGNHHGSCNGTSERYLQLTRPEVVVFSLSATNGYGHVHTQTLDLLRSARIPWYRTDQNGEVIISVPGTPGSGYMVEASRGDARATGPSDRTSDQSSCR
jgi:competence protein ComEC